MNFWRTGILSLFLLWGHHLALVSQNIAKEGQFYIYSVSHGLPTVEVYDILQDHKGYIWLGTEAGLCRFDGYRFTTYTTKDGLPNNDVLDIQEDQEGRIWINSLGPLAYFKNDSVVTYDLSLQDIYAGVRVIPNGEGEYWINYGGEVFLIDTARQLIPQVEPEDAFHVRYYKHRLVQQGKYVWVANRQFIFKFEGKQLLEKIPLQYSKSKTDGFQVEAFGQYIYYTSDEGLIAIDTESEARNQWVVSSFLNEANQIQVIDNDLWLVSLEKGVFQLEVKKGGEINIIRNLLPNSNTTRMIKDMEGNIWVASYGNGVYFLPINADKFKIIGPWSNAADSKLESVTTMNGRVAVGDYKGNIHFYYEDQPIETVPITANSEFSKRILEMMELPSGAILVGTDRGLWKYTPQSLVYLHTHPVKNIFCHPDGRILINTFRGTFSTDIRILDTVQWVANPKEYEKIGFEKVYEERSYSALIDSKEQIWIGNSWTGLTKITADTTIFFREIAPVFSSVFIDLVELENGVICGATQGDGLVLIKEDDYFLINEENGLSGTICNDLQTNGKELWVATNKGISHVRNINFEEQSFRLSVFNEADGLVSSQIEAIDFADSLLVMATSKGLMTANIQDLRKNEKAPLVYITDVIVNEESRTLQDVYYLAHDQNNIQIQYVGLSYKSHGNILYKYKLEGVDKDWITTTSLETHYSKLPPGNYKFKVAAIGNSGLESQQVGEIQFLIQPHLFQTKAFQGGLALLAFALLYLIYSFLSNYLQKAKLERLVDEKTRALNEKYKDLEEINAKLELSNRELQQFAHVASHDLKAPLRNVAGFVQLLGRKAGHKLDQDEKDYIQFAVKGVKKMNDIIQDLLSMSKIDQLEEEKEAVCFEDVVTEVIEELQFQIAEKNAEVSIDGNFPVLHFNRTNAKQLLQNLISNALTYQDKKKPKVEVNCSAENGHWLFGIKDNGIGIAPEYGEKVFELFQRLHGQDDYSGTGIGLAICKKIVEKNKGKIWYTSQEGVGTTFYFTLPNDITIDYSPSSN